MTHTPIRDLNTVTFPRQRFWSRPWRPGWRVFVVLSFVFGVAGILVTAARADDAPAQQEAVPGAGGAQGGDQALGGPVGDPKGGFVQTGERFAPASRSPRQAVVDLAERYFPPEMVPWAIRTSACESGYDLNAHNAGFDRRLGVPYDFWGALQIDAVTWGAKAWELFGGPLSSTDVNWQMAAWIARTYGVGHWPVCGQGGW